MRVKRVGYVGLRTTEPEAMTWFLREVVGLEAAGEDETVTFQRLPTGMRDYVEVYAAGHTDERMIPNGVDFMVSFVVDDLDSALAEVHAARLEVIGDVVWAADGFGWFFVRAPDGRVYAIQQTPE
jgi:catechol 2,3-dioxygenase-like lactoylglutathione lyase family enzyme